MVYLPAEDSELLKKVVIKYAHGKVLEIGTGSGVLAKVAAEKDAVEKVLGVDIDPEAIAYAKEHNPDKKIEYKESNLFQEVTGKYHTIIFNPPYLPEDKREDEKTALATTGGKKGHEITQEFLEKASDHLSSDGMILLLFSSLTTKEKIDEILKDNLWNKEKISSQKIAFEELFVYKIIKNTLRKELEHKGITGLKRFSKGQRGYIFTGLFDGKKVAIKYQIPQLDAQGTVDNEAKKLKILNEKGIGPKLLFSGKDYFVYQFVEGEFILEYFSHVNQEEVRRVLREVLQQMRTLDKMGLNKEEMHHPLKHIIIGKEIVLLDFERCKHRKAHNVTQFVQFIVGGHMKPYIQDIDRDGLLENAKKYSKENSEEEFEKLIKALE